MFCWNALSALTQLLFHCSSTVGSGSWGCCAALKPHCLFAELSVAPTHSQLDFTACLHLQICYMPTLGEGLMGKHWKRDLEKDWVGDRQWGAFTYDFSNCLKLSPDSVWAQGKGRLDITLTWSQRQPHLQGASLFFRRILSFLGFCNIILKLFTNNLLMVR